MMVNDSGEDGVLLILARLRAGVGGWILAPGPETVAS
jgi:hypothetical protein